MFDYNDNNHKQPMGYANDGQKITGEVGISKGSNKPLMPQMPE